jgi:hypothetical protein
MFFILIAALATPVATPAVSAPTTVVISPEKREMGIPDIAAMMGMMDKFFPAGPEPDPARLALARSTVAVMLPPGELGKAMNDMMGGMADRVMAMRPSDFPGLATKNAVAKNNVTLHQSMVAKDPYFDERMRLTRTAMMAELARAAVIIEPRLREGFARALARRLDQRQLVDVSGFFATPSGQALGRHYLGMWWDGDVVRAMMQTMPELMKLMPGAVQRVTAATASLPKPATINVYVEPSKPVTPRTRPRK